MIASAFNAHTASAQRLQPGTSAAPALQMLCSQLPKAGSLQLVLNWQSPATWQGSWIPSATDAGG